MIGDPIYNEDKFTLIQTAISESIGELLIAITTNELRVYKSKDCSLIKTFKGDFTSANYLPKAESIVAFCSKSNELKILKLHRNKDDIP